MSENHFPSDYYFKHVEFTFDDPAKIFCQIPLLPFQSPKLFLGKHFFEKKTFRRKLNLDSLEEGSRSLPKKVNFLSENTL